jgi:hypothetical protein
VRSKLLLDGIGGVLGAWDCDSELGIRKWKLVFFIGRTLSNRRDSLC